MKTLTLILFVTLSLNTFAQTLKPTRPYRVVRTLIADLNNDHRPDTIRLLSPFDDWNSFNKISISLNGYGKTTLKARDYWTVIDSAFLAANKNAIHTRLLFVKSTPVHSVILLLGPSGEAEFRGECSLINIENNKVSMAYDQIDGDKLLISIALPIALTDLNHDGRLDFVSKDYGEYERPVAGGNIGSYDPYYVCAVYANFKIDTSLTKAYNQKHYVYAGLNFDKEIRIFYPNNGGKPRLWKERAAKK